MVGVSRRKNIRLLSVFGIFVLISLTRSEASSMVNNLDKVVVYLNGSNLGLQEKHQNEENNSSTSSPSTRLEKTSFNCSENSCAHEELRTSRSRLVKEVALQASPITHLIPTSISLDPQELSNSGSVTNHRNFSYNDYQPVQYGQVSEGRSLTAGILFLIFSIIQFKIVFGAMILFLAVSPLILFIMFGPMILFLVFGPMLMMMMV